jgi:hypothetical protein
MSKIKSIVRAIMPKFIWYGLSVAKRILVPNGAVSLKNIKFIKNKNKVIVLGNGPSLKNDLEKINEIKDDYDFVCVNNFCSSPYYKSFKPSIYVFLDRYFFSEKTIIKWIKQREETFKIINNETTWKMQILLPANADISILKKQIKNKNIEIIKHMTIESNKTSLFNSGYFGPSQVNVLIYAVYFSIWAKYNSIEIYGADMDFYKNIEVDQRTNLKGRTTKHFNKKNDPIDPKNDFQFTMSEHMKLFSYAFKAHELLEDYANKKNFLILNKSSFSMIDAYKRENNIKENK